MEKQLNERKFLEVESLPQLGMSGILQESFRTAVKNGKIMLLTGLSMASFYTLLFLVTDLISNPIANDMVLNLMLLRRYAVMKVNHPEIVKALQRDVGLYILLVLVLYALAFLMQLILSVITIHSTYEAYTAKVLSKFEVFSHFKGIWKRPLKTALYTSLISLISLIVLSITTSLIILITEGFPLYILTLLLAVVGTLYTLYMDSLGMLSLVVSVVEENVSGLKAIRRAEKLLKGKRLQGCILMLLYSFSMAVIFVLVFLVIIKLLPGRWTLLALMIVQFWFLNFMILTLNVTYTVFYHECKKINTGGLKENLDCYVPLSASEV